ncbi:bifunctional non-homologous end joining protein LigD [Streptomyces zhaozhouensis]|uniref:DNA ligase (ATP) n=1 Tax=Streptomyces zhaozhouensis TaxID=1300267 RepID=A0A286DXB6_9ACTN|nr:non-homologous end-joining DNA ligase [Streptomyces zhaozhouensis]SOD63308.1 bifunctional non-homologous end joining protein LigD [Streptomyces zhaozhouensis]
MTKETEPPPAVPDAVAPMLAVDGRPPTGARWAYEWKWDGYRCCLRVAADGQTRLTSRNGNDLTPTYPELAQAGPGPLAGRSAVLDGEIVALGPGGGPDFGRLQRRHQRRHPGRALLAEVPVVFFAFDLLMLDGERLLDLPYRRRRAALEALPTDPSGRIAVPPSHPGAEADPEALLRVAEAHGLEGLMAKRLDSPYQPGRRSPRWVKTPLVRTIEVVVGGWQPGSGHRAGTVGSLLVGAFDEDGRLRYVGHVGSGFSEAVLADLDLRLAGLSRADSPFAERLPTARTRVARWVEPRLVGEVAFRAWTREGRLRQPSWRGARPDRDPAAARLPDRPY